MLLLSTFLNHVLRVIKTCLSRLLTVYILIFHLKKKKRKMVSFTSFFCRFSYTFRSLFLSRKYVTDCTCKQLFILPVRNRLICWTANGHLPPVAENRIFTPSRPSSAVRCYFINLNQIKHLSID